MDNIVGSFHLLSWAVSFRHSHTLTLYGFKIIYFIRMQINQVSGSKMLDC